MCNYTARAFRALTYLSLREYICIPFLLLLQNIETCPFSFASENCVSPFPFASPPPARLEGLVLEVGGSFEDFQKKVSNAFDSDLRKWLLMRGDNHCKS